MKSKKRSQHKLAFFRSDLIDQSSGGPWKPAVSKPFAIFVFLKTKFRLFSTCQHYRFGELCRYSGVHLAKKFLLASVARLSEAF